MEKKDTEIMAPVPAGRASSDNPMLPELGFPWKNCGAVLEEEGVKSADSSLPALCPEHHPDMITWKGLRRSGRAFLPCRM